MSEFWLKPRLSHMQIMVGWHGAKHLYYVELEVYDGAPAPGKLMERRIVFDRKAEHAIELAALYAIIPDDLESKLARLPALPAKSAAR